MKRGFNIFLIGLGVSFLISLLFNSGRFNSELLTGVGLFNLLIGCLMLFIAGICLLTGNKQTAQAYAIAAGLLLLTGTLTCSIFPLKLRLM